MTGIVLLDKGGDISSFWAAKQLKRLYNEKKLGHTGTLDPMASGLLPVMLGSATKFLPYLPSHDKAYTATLKLGVTTDTLDITGEVISTREVSVSPEQFTECMKSFEGKIKQVPPMYSAISIDGVRLYTLARQGIEVEREARDVEIKKIECIGSSGDEYTIDVHCSSGTYIRSLVYDIGEKLGCGAVLTVLRRTWANGFSVENAKTLDELRNASPEELESFVLPIDKALEEYPQIIITDNQSKRFKNGGELDRARLKNNPDEGMYRVYSHSREFLGVGEITGEILAVRRLLV
ncbi:MAG: tRNA pseudouridine(55) synthase TruB [Clostridia bacterium]|nr:tRNA pseudouridine(55) synthase TruB [Clostridia bacterium]